MPSHLLRFFTIALLLFLYVAKYQCQDEYQLVKHLTTDNGLPSNNVYSVIKDKTGFLWFATDQGVVKYDGTHLKTFTTNDGLTQNDIFDLKEDRWGRIWALNLAPEICYIKDDIVRTIKSDIEGFDFESFQEDDQGIIFRNYEQYLFEEEDAFKINDGNNRKFLEFIFEYPHHIIVKDGSNINFKIKKPDYIKSQRIYPLANRFLAFYDFKKNELVTINTEKRNSITRQISNLGNDSGLYKLRSNDDHYQLVVNGSFWKYYPAIDSLHNIEGKTFLKQDGITSFTEIDDLIIISSLKSGVFFLKKTYKSINSFNIGNVSASSSFSDYVIAGDDLGSIFVIDKNLNEIVKIKAPEELFNSDIRNIYHDPKKQILGFTSFNLGVLILKYSERVSELRFDTIYNNKKYAGISKVLYQDQIYGTAKSGILGWTNNSEHDRVFKSQFTPNDAVILDDSIMWLGQNKQLIRLNFLDRTWQKHLTNYNVTKIQPYRNALLAGTDGQGVFLFDPNTKSSKSLLENISVTDIDIDSNWVAISSTTGIYLLDANKQYQLVKHLYKGNSLNSNQINHVNFLNGRLLAFSNDGAQSIDLLSLRDTLASKIYIDHPTLSYNSEVTLDSTRTLQFTIRTIDYNNRELDFYVSLEMEGSADNFELSPSLATRFVGLRPGTHVLKVYGQEKYSLQRTATIERQIIVKHKFYEYLLFQLLLLSLLILFVGYLFRRRLKKISKVNEAQLALERTYAGIELQALQSQLNPHFVFNCLSSIQALIKENKTDLANLYLIKFSKLMRMFLEQSSSHVTTLENEIEINKLYLELEKLRFKEKLEYKITIDKNVNDLSIPIPAVFVQPFVENAIRHGIFHQEGIGHIKLYIYKVDETLKIEISDNGIGIEKSKELNEKTKLGHVSKSLEIIKRKTELVKAINEFIVDIDTLSSEAKGTKITLSIQRA